MNRRYLNSGKWRGDPGGKQAGLAQEVAVDRALIARVRAQKTTTQPSVKPRGEPWTAAEEQFLRDHYGKVPPAEIARALGRTKPSVAGRAGELGLRRKKEPRWTAEEIAYLRRNWGRESLYVIAMKLRKTETAVLLKSKRLGLGAANGAQGEWSVRLVAAALGIDDHAITQWIKDGLLLARTLPPRFRAGENSPRTIYQIRVADLVRFLRAHPDRWNAARCPDLYLSLGQIDVIRAGAARKPPPPWFAEKLAADRARPPREGQRWTRAEDRRLAEMMRQGLGYAEIGRVLGRSPDGVCHRFYRLGSLIWDLVPPPPKWQPVVRWQKTPEAPPKPPRPGPKKAEHKRNPERAERLMELLLGG